MCQCLLIKKLKMFMFEIGILRWIEGFLIGRSMAVSVDGVISSY